MSYESYCGYMVDWWYMGIGCSNHKTKIKQWLIDFDSRKRTKFICVGENYLIVEGMRNVKVKVKNGNIVLIKVVWYVPSMKRNRMSVRRLIKKGFSVTIKN